MTQSLLRDHATSAVAVMAGRVLGAVGGVASARLLGVEGKGRYAVLIAVGSFAGTAATLGLQFWVTREVAAGRASADLRRLLLRHTAGVASIVAALTALAVSIGGAEAVSAAEMAAVAAFAVAWVASMLWLAVANGKRRFDLVALATTAGGAVYLAWIAVAEVIDAQSVVSVVLGAAAGNAVAIPVLHRLTRSVLVGGQGVGAKWDEYRRAVGYGWPAAAGELVLYAAFRVDVVLVGILLDARRAGLYAVALAVAELVWVVADAVAQAVLARVAAAPSVDEDRTTRLALASMVAAAIALALLGPWIVPLLFGDAFRDAVTPLRLLLPGAVAIGTWKIVAADVAARGETRSRAASAVTGLLVMVVADLLLVPRHGLAGAAVASTLGYLAAAAVVVTARRRLVGRSLFRSPVRLRGVE